MSPHAIGPYQLQRKLGSGAMGIVYEALDTRTHQLVALKLMRPELVARADLLARFERETSLAMTFSHPNLLPVLERGVSNTIPWAAMPLIHDQRLADHIARHGPLTTPLAISITKRVLSALAMLHTHKLCHRDVKPENVLFDGQHVYLTDLGLAIGPDHSRLTQHQQPLGTPGYMAPEQWRGEMSDARTDVFAAGVLLYFFLSGRLPYPGEHHVAMVQRLLDHPPDPLQLDPSEHTLEPIIMTAIARDPDDRFPNAEAFLTQRNAWCPIPRRVTPLHFPSPLRSLPKEDSMNTDLRSNTPVGLNHKSPLPNRDNAPTDPKKLAILPVEIAPDTYWVGKRTPHEIFYANPYLRTFKGKEGQFNLLIDPGSSADFSVVQAKSSRIIGDMTHISAIFINHQDPDVASSAGTLLGRYAQSAHTLCTEDTWRLVQYYNIPRERFIALEKYPKGFSIPTGHWLLPVPSPFCHFVGAMMLYDPQTRVLFTGDLFGGLTDRNAQGLWADESDWVGMRAFHQIYMPTRQALKHAFANIRAIDGEIELIAPQHGRLIRGEWIAEFMRRLENLPVGLDIITDRQATPEELNAWSAVLERAISSIDGLCDIDLRAALLEDPELRGLMHLRSGRLEITALGKFTLERAIRVMCDLIKDGDLLSTVKYEVIFASSELNLPTPVMELDEDGGAPSGSSMLGSVGMP